jgi:hypothetical protein
MDLVAGRQQRPNQQPPVSLDPDHHLPWILCMGGHQGVQLPHPGQPIGDPPSREHAAVLVSRHRSWRASPQSSPTNITASSSAPTSLSLSQRRTCGALMAVLTGWWLRRSLPPKARAAPLGSLPLDPLHAG